MSKSAKTIALWVVLIVMFVAIYQIVGPEQSHQEQPEFSKVAERMQAGEIADLTITVTGPGSAGTFEGRLSDGRSFKTTGVLSDRVEQLLAEHGVVYRVHAKSEGGLWQTVLTGWLPVFVVLLFVLILIRQMQGKGTNFTEMKQATPRASVVEGRKVSFHELIGAEEATTAAHVVIDALLEIKQKKGGRSPPSLLIAGQPGTGKTLLLDAIAAQAGVPVLCLDGSQLIEVFAGVGAARIRDLFEKAKKQAPAIVVIDGLDAFGRTRGENVLSTGADEREQTLHQLLASMTETAEKRLPIAVVATTSRLDLLDPGLTKSGRFGRIVEIPMPAEAEVTALLQQLTKDVSLHGACDPALLASRARGLAPGQIRAAIDQAVAESKGEVVTAEILARALDRMSPAQPHSV